MRYPIVFWDSGGTIFHSSDRPEGFGFPSPGQVRGRRAFRTARALEMFGHSFPADLDRELGDLEGQLKAQHGARYSLEMLAGGLYRQLGIVERYEEVLLVADALAGPRYREWLWDGVAEAFAALHGAGVRMGVIADTMLTGRMMRRALTGVGLAKYLGPVICSCDLGVQKPDARIFQAALEGLGPEGFRGDRVLYVGDDLERDIGGATAFGWDAALHGAAGSDSRAVLTFQAYRDLVRLVLEGG